MNIFAPTESTLITRATISFDYTHCSANLNNAHCGSIYFISLRKSLGHSFQVLHNPMHSGHQVQHSLSNCIRPQNQLFIHNTYTCPPSQLRGNPRPCWVTGPEHRVIAPAPPKCSEQLLGHSDYTTHAVGHAEQLTYLHNVLPYPCPRGQQMAQQHLIALPVQTLPV